MVRVARSTDAAVEGNLAPRGLRSRITARGDGAEAVEVEALTVGVVADRVIGEPVVGQTHAGLLALRNERDLHYGRTRQNRMVRFVLLEADHHLLIRHHR